MKGTVLSAAIAASCVVAVVLSSGALNKYHPGDSTIPTATDRRLDRIEAGFDRIERLETKVRDLSAFIRSTAATVADQQVKSPAPEREVIASSRPEGPADEARLRELIEEDIVNVIDDIVVERIAAQQRRGPQAWRGYDMMQDGPFGEYNFRMNALTTVLGLSGSQTEEYYNYIVEYDSLIRDQHDLEKNDEAHGEFYQARRDELREEFIDIATEIFTPEQARLFRSFPEIARTPGGPSQSATLLAALPEHISEVANARHGPPPPRSD